MIKDFNWLKRLLILVTVLTATTFLFPLNVAAEQLCIPGTETSGCIPCTPGPYNICVPDTDIIIGDAVINNEMLLIILGVYTLGAFFIVNGALLSKKFFPKISPQF